MVLTIKGVTLEESPPSPNSLFQQHPLLKEVSAALVTEKSQVLGPPGLLYVSTREYAVTHSHDTKVLVVGTDDVTTGLVIIIRHTTSGAVGVAQVDRLTDEGLSTFLQKVASLAYGYDGRTELHLVGAFADTKGLGAALVNSALAALHRQRSSLELVTLCVGELCTVRRSGTPWPLLYGLGVNVKTGDIFPAQFTDKGPDMDLRTARTLTGGESVGLMDIYDYQREELRIGPFTYEPMRAVDIWLQQTDEFVLKSLHPCPEVSPPSFLPLLRQTLKRIKQDPYPSVSVFGSNQPRLYRKDDHSGHWVRYSKEPETWGPAATTQQHSFKQEPVPGWPPGIPVQSQLYY